MNTSGWIPDEIAALRHCAKSQEVLEAMKERAAKLPELEAGRKRRAPVKHLQLPEGEGAKDVECRAL